MKRNISSLVCGMAAVLTFTAVVQAAPAAALHLRVTHQKKIPRSKRPTPARYVPRGTGKTRVSLTFAKTPIRTALQLLFRRANQSFVLGEGVSGTTTATLHNVPFDTALHQVLSVNSVPLVSSLVRGVYVIKPQHQATHRTHQRRFMRRRRYYHPPIIRRAAPYHVPGTGGTVRVAP